MAVDAQGTITEFVEKPDDVGAVKSMAVSINHHDSFLANMGIYLFNKSALTKILSENRKADFGKEIIPDAIKNETLHAFVYNGYWRDIGTVKSFYEENLALTHSLAPLNMFNQQWQFFTHARFLPPSNIDECSVASSIVSDGAVLKGATIQHSVIGLRAKIEPGCKISDSIIMGSDYYEMPAQARVNKQRKIPNIGIGKKCTIQKAIIDKNVRIGNNVKIINKKKIMDFESDMYCIKNGIVIVTKNAVIPSGTEI